MEYPEEYVAKSIWDRNLFNMTVEPNQYPQGELNNKLPFLAVWDKLREVFLLIATVIALVIGAVVYLLTPPLDLADADNLIIDSSRISPIVAILILLISAVLGYVLVWFVAQRSDISAKLTFSPLVKGRMPSGAAPTKFYRIVPYVSVLAALGALIALAGVNPFENASERAANTLMFTFGIPFDYPIMAFGLVAIIFGYLGRRLRCRPIQISQLGLVLGVFVVALSLTKFGLAFRLVVSNAVGGLFHP